MIFCVRCGEETVQEHTSWYICNECNINVRFLNENNYYIYYMINEDIEITWTMNSSGMACYLYFITEMKQIDLSSPLPYDITNEKLNKLLIMI